MSERWCPSCGEAAPAGATTCAACGAAVETEPLEVAAAAAAAAPPPATAYLGEFPGLQCELVLDILREHGIYAFAKNPKGESEHSQYGPMLSVDGAILADAARIGEARQILARELPEHLASIERAMAEMEAGEAGERDQG